MTITVIHLNLSDEQRDEVNHEGWNCATGKAYLDAKHYGKYVEALELGMLKPVALMNLDADCESDLEACFRDTNHIDTDWTENDTVIFHADQVRSSSTGDIFADAGGELYRVATFGFKFILESDPAWDDINAVSYDFSMPFLEGDKRGNGKAAV